MSDPTRTRGFSVQTENCAVLLTILGPLHNYANKGGYFGGLAKAGYQKRWREKVQAIALATRGTWHPSEPKRITMTALVWNLFDAHDGLRNACKPVVDGLVRGGVIHSDAPNCGHIFEYGQRIDRARRGIEILIQRTA